MCLWASQKDLVLSTTNRQNLIKHVRCCTVLAARRRLGKGRGLCFPAVEMSAAESPTQVLLDVEADLAQEACAVMHDAFAQYAEQGQASGALLETPESLCGEMLRDTRLAVAVADGRVAAMVKYQVHSDDTLYFSRLAVATAARGRGLAGLLLRALRGEAEKRGLAGLPCSVRASETENIAIYEHLGMRVTKQETRESLTGATIPVVLMADA